MARRPRSGGNSPSRRERDEPWWSADEGGVWETLIPYVEQVERNQSDLFDRFMKLAVAYDPYSPLAGYRDRDARDIAGQMQENLIASNCDAITGSITAADVRARFKSDDADWSQQRTLKNLTWYAEGISTLLDLDAHCREAFHAASLKGTGFVKVWIDEWDEIRSEVVAVDDIIVDDSASRGCPPRHLAQRKLIGREVLAAAFPEKEYEIGKAQTAGRQWRKWAGYRPLREDEIVCIETWRLPIGPKGHPHHKPGRHTICIDGCDLFDDRKFEGDFPFAIFRWVKRPDSFYGIGGGERIMGHQRKLNKRNLQIDRQHDQHAFPTTWVQLPDANLSVKSTNRAGSIGVYRASIPQTVTPSAISPETFRDRDDTKGSAFEEFGQSRMQATAMKPAGLDSGVALREYRDQTTSRFATQEKGYERLKLDSVMLAIGCAKRLGAGAPVIIRKSKFGSRKIPWAKVDVGELKVQIVAASALGRTPAGRTQFIMEMAQAGLISRDSSQRLLFPNGTLDIEAEMSRYVADLESLEHTIDEIEDGAILVPEPHDNLTMGIWRFNGAYKKDRDDGAPEPVLEALRQWIVLAEYMLSLAEQPDPAAQPGPPGDMAIPGDPMAAAAPPTSALAPTAMNLRAA